MKKFFTLTLLLAGLCVSVPTMAQTTTNASETQYIPKLEPGTTAPEITASTPEGKTLTLSSFKGKYVVIDFWASWCGDCRRDFPAFKELVQAYKGNEKVVFYSVSFDHNAENWKNFLKTNNVDWPSVSNLKPWKQNPIAKDYKLNWIPSLYIISPEGKVVGRAIHTKDIKTQLEQLVK